MSVSVLVDNLKLQKARLYRALPAGFAETVLAGFAYPSKAMMHELGTARHSSTDHLVTNRHDRELDYVASLQSRRTLLLQPTFLQDRPISFVTR